MAYADAQSGAIIHYGGSPGTVKLGGVVSKGDAIGISSGVWVRALATVTTVVQLRAVAAEDGATDQEITAYFGIVIMGGRISGATAGGALYVAEGSDSGEYIQAIPTTTGDATTVVGYMLSATIGVITPSFNTDSVA
uniref:Uncharacterized protein n=1 Tax=viral metagenome TaxID=1070528 RepID=A0A6M3LL31_9ZZZZ